MLPLATALRPKQWTKNLFVLAPLVFGKAVFRPGAALAAVAAAASFCAVASALYLVNDVADREADRAHPIKRERPVASGALSPAAALAAAAVLLAAGLGLSAILAPPAVRFLAIYAGVTVAYTFFLKRIALLDVFVIASGFVLRVLAGAAAVSVPASHWLLLCTFFLALFLGLSKRRSELAGSGAAGRAWLADVPLALLESFESVALGTTIVAYALYTVSPETIVWVGSDRLLVTVPFVVYGLFRWRLLEVRGRGEDASSDLFTDPGLLATVLLWGLTCAGLIYSAPAR